MRNEIGPCMVEVGVAILAPRSGEALVGDCSSGGLRGAGPALSGMETAPAIMPDARQSLEGMPTRRIVDYVFAMQPDSLRLRIPEGHVMSKDMHAGHGEPAQQVFDKLSERGSKAYRGSDMAHFGQQYRGIRLFAGMHLKGKGLTAGVCSLGLAGYAANGSLVGGRMCSTLEDGHRSHGAGHGYGMYGRVGMSQEQGRMNLAWKPRSASHGTGACYVLADMPHRYNVAVFLSYRSNWAMTESQYEAHRI